VFDLYIYHILVLVIEKHKGMNHLKIVQLALLLFMHCSMQTM